MQKHVNHFKVSIDKLCLLETTDQNKADRLAKNLTKLLAQNGVKNKVCQEHRKEELVEKATPKKPKIKHSGESSS